MLLMKHKMAFLGAMYGDLGAIVDSKIFHEELKSQHNKYILSPIGMWLEEFFKNKNSHMCSLLQRKAEIALAKS